MSASTTIFNIQRFSIHDGPGIRTSVFLKGCVLSCFWCHNPEGRFPDPELRYFPARCIACGDCVTACPNHAHELSNGVHIFHRDRCQVSGCCIDTCYSNALQMEGKLMTVEEVLDEVLRDKPFYQTSGGGVTLTGGEPVINGGFTLDFLQRCKSAGVHTAVETCGEYPWESLGEILPFTDLVMMDIKHMDKEKHLNATGRSNDRILANARKLAQTDIPVVFRTPVVPGFNDTHEEIRRIASYIRTLREARRNSAAAGDGTAAITYELLTFHKLAMDKYSSLGMEYSASALDSPTKDQMSGLLEAARNEGIEVLAR